MTLAVLFVLLVFPLGADDVGITPARLIESANGGYALEADVAPRMVAALREPVVPERFTLADRPNYRRVGVNLVVRYEFGGSDQALEAGDVLLLPWARSAVVLTARWADGTVRRGMFPRGAAGIRVPIEALKPVKRSPMVVARDHLDSEIVLVIPMLLRTLVVLVIVVAAGGWWAVRLALVFAFGHALSMVALDIGIPAILGGLAGSGLALGAVLLARWALREDRARLWPLVLAVGVVDGLGIAGRLVSAGVAPGDLVPALFGTAIMVDAMIVAATAVLAMTVGRSGLSRAFRWVTVATGAVGVAALISLTVSGLSAAEDVTIDPADRMAAERFELRSGAGGGGGGSGGRAAAAPRRLEDAAMVFLTVEPNEVRVEVLLSLREFLEPLRIEGGPGSVVPVEVQPAIEERAKRMVAKTIGVVIDGRETVPILERSDFVTVSATGVTIRREPQPEPLATSVLGVTVVHGAERPPSEIELGWQVFPEGSAGVPAVWLDPTGSDKTALTPQDPVLRWSNDVSSFARRPMEAVVVNPPKFPLASMALLGVAAVVWFGFLRGRRWRSLAWVAVVTAVVLYPFARTEATLPGLGGWAPDRAEAGEVVQDLLTNVYRSFDLRGEEAIYERLSLSLVGDMLTEVYLDNRRALELEDRGGARARVDEVEVQEVRSVRRDGEGGFRVETVWVVSASVNHFGHVHYRQNRYDAQITIRADDGAWKIHGLEMLDQRRLL